MGRAQGLSHLAAAAGVYRRGNYRQSRIWTDERLEAELRRFVAGRETWPTSTALTAAGRGDLHGAICKSGGYEYWAERLGMSLARRWTPEKLEAALRAFVGDRPDWPTAPEFIAAGRSDLRDAVKRHGGAVEWARRLNKQLRPGQDRGRYDESDAMADALENIKRHGHLPSCQKLRTLGYHRLASFIQRRYPGGMTAYRANLTAANPSVRRM